MYRKLENILKLKRKTDIKEMEARKNEVIESLKSEKLDLMN